MICGTDTLGVGINVPIRTVVFTGLAKFDGTLPPPELLDEMRRAREARSQFGHGRVPVGILTERDLLLKLEDANLAHRVRELMTPDPEVLRPDDPIVYALHRMAVMLQDTRDLMQRSEMLPAESARTRLMCSHSTRSSDIGLSASAVTSASAFAAAPDVSGVVTEIGGTAAPIAAIGAAVLLVFVGIKTFKWVRRAM